MNLRIREVMVLDDTHPIFLTEEDVLDFNVAASCIDKELDRDEILTFLVKNIHIYYRGKMFGFNDTEVREEICGELK